jgi:hypothetical protein
MTNYIPYSTRIDQLYPILGIWFINIGFKPVIIILALEIPFSVIKIIHLLINNFINLFQPQPARTGGAYAHQPGSLRRQIPPFVPGKSAAAAQPYSQIRPGRNLK